MSESVICLLLKRCYQHSIEIPVILLYVDNRDTQ